jgi:hypothetical protein
MGGGYRRRIAVWRGEVKREKSPEGMKGGVVNRE